MPFFLGWLSNDLKIKILLDLAINGNYILGDNRISVNCRVDLTCDMVDKCQLTLHHGLEFSLDDNPPIWVIA